MVLYLFIILHLSDSIVCNPYQCAPAEFKMPSNFCSVSYNNTFFLAPCDTSHYCEIPTGQCQKIPSNLPQPQYPGEPCTKSSDCTTNSCVQSICKGLSSNSTCLSHEECDPGLRCYKESCQKQLDVTDMNCFNDFDCINSAGCNLPQWSMTGTCTAYFSVPVGQLVSDCIEGVSYLCKSSECKKIGKFGNFGYCKASFISVKPSPVKCTSSNDCKGTDGLIEDLSDCICGYNSAGNAYCEVFSGDLPALEYFETWQKALVQSLGRCNTVRRFEKDCLLAVGKFNEVLRATWKYQYYPLVQNNDQCVKEMITYEAYTFDSMGLVLMIYSLTIVI